MFFKNSQYGKLPNFTKSVSGSQDSPRWEGCARWTVHTAGIRKWHDGGDGGGDGDSGDGDSGDGDGNGDDGGGGGGDGDV